MVYSEEELRLMARTAYEARVNRWDIFNRAVGNSTSTTSSNTHDDTNLEQQEPHSTTEHEFPPKFDIAEVEPSQILGTGGFCTVREIEEIILLRRDKNKSTTTPCTSARSLDYSSNRSETNDSELDYSLNHQTLPATAVMTTDAILDDSAGSTTTTLSNSSRAKRLRQDNALINSQSMMRRQKSFIRRHTRRYMANNYLRNGCGRYALKTLTHSRVRYDGEDGEQHFVTSVIDLALEAKLLSHLSDHPNIIKIRGVMNATSYCEKDFFIILDRLYETLADRINVTWKKKYNKMNVLPLVTDCGGMKRNSLNAERLRVAYYIARALEHIHEHRMVYRDLKPFNIGFDVRGDVKLFDFGLTREMPQSASILPINTATVNPTFTTTSTISNIPNRNELFLMTAYTGSFRYMAPEVNRERAYYNQSMDVYSFGILLWQMMFLETPFKHHYSPQYHKKQVDKGVRPQLNDRKLKQWANSDVLRDLLVKSWSGNITDRPCIDGVLNVLRETLASAYGKVELDFSDRTGDSWISMKSQRSHSHSSC